MNPSCLVGPLGSTPTTGSTRLPVVAATACHKQLALRKPSDSVRIYVGGISVSLNLPVAAKVPLKKHNTPGVQEAPQHLAAHHLPSRMSTCFSKTYDASVPCVSSDGPAQTTAPQTPTRSHHAHTHTPATPTEHTTLGGTTGREGWRSTTHTHCSSVT